MKLKQENKLHEKYQYTTKEKAVLVVLGGLAAGGFISLLALLCLEVPL